MHTYKSQDFEVIRSGQLDKNGLLAGLGSKLYIDKTKAGKFEQGGWTGDKLNGFSITVWQTGDIYIGQKWQDKRQGMGKMVWHSGSTYEGEWHNDMMFSHGKMTLDTGDSYNGEWKHGLKHGQGEYVWANGSYYRGKYCKDLQHGKGKLVYADGTTFEGLFEKGHYTQSYMDYKKDTKRSLETEMHSLESEIQTCKNDEQRKVLGDKVRELKELIERCDGCMQANCD